MSTPAVPPLWPQPIPIIGGTGAVGSGKTRFGISICPGPQTLVYDLEQSSLPYAHFGFERIDVQREMYKTHPKGYKAVDLWVWWLAHVRALPINKYRVIMVDPVTDLENGLVDWVDANPKHFGHTEGQYASMSALKWGDVKAYEKMVLADVSARCETFYFTTHITAEWEDKKPVKGKFKPKGKETLDQLASLYLWFSRETDPKTGEKPKVPSAQVRKGRFEVPKLNPDGTLATNEYGDPITYEVLPPKMPVATPGRLRWYFDNPIGRTGVKEAERVKEEVVVLSADERLKLETAKAEAERDAALARAATAAAQQTTVVITHAPPEEQRGDTSAWETSFSAAIEKADTPDDLNAIPPQIKVCRERGHLADENVQRLRDLYGERKKHLEGLAATDSPK